MNTKAYRVRYESSADEGLIEHLTDDNHISNYRNNWVLMSVYQDFKQLERQDYTFDIRQRTDRIVFPSENPWSHGMELDIAVYQLIIPHGVGYKVDDKIYWERMEDHFLRKKVFDSGWVIEYNSGYICGTDTTYITTSAEWTSSEKIAGYEMWQKYRIFKYKQ